MPRSTNPDTPVSAIPEFIEDGDSGVLAPDDPPALADALQALARDPARRAAHAEAAYRRLTEGFAMEPGIDQLETRLDAMLAGVTHDD